MSFVAAAGHSPGRLIVLEPGHFHAALLQKEMYAQLAPNVSVYAPLGPELLDYLNRVSLFNHRAAEPTAWQLDVHTSADPLAAMLRDKPGNIVVFSGRNRSKIDRMLASIDAGLHVLADKPWIVDSSDLGKLELALDMAAEKTLAAYDIMTERHEVSAQLQRALVNLPEVFGTRVAGDSANPGVYAYSVHHIMKTVAGVPLRRPAWFFDVDDYGEGLADVGTHPVDLIQWTLFPEQMLDYRKDIRMISGRHDAVAITKEQFAMVTGAVDFPASLHPKITDGVLSYFCNNYVEYALKGVHVKLDVLWKWEAAPGTGDVYEAAFQGTKSSIQLRQNAAGNFIPELYVVPVAGATQSVFAALKAALPELQKQWPGISLAFTAAQARIAIPATLRVGHEDHFGQVARDFFEYVGDAASVPAWERGYMLAKYYVSTKGVEMARR